LACVFHSDFGASFIVHCSATTIQLLAVVLSLNDSLAQSHRPVPFPVHLLSLVEDHGWTTVYYFYHRLVVVVVVVVKMACRERDRGLLAPRGGQASKQLDTQDGLAVVFAGL